MNGNLNTEDIEKLISEENWTDAMKELCLLMQNGFNDRIALCSAAINFRFGNIAQAFDMISKGLQYNYKNYELYLMLGDYYYSENPNLTYLCYENAKFYCNNDEDREVIEQMLNNLLNTNKISVKRVSIIILSYNNKHMTIDCINSLRRTNMSQTYELVVVDNASEDGSVEWLEEQRDIKLIKNDVNQGFPRGCNQGIRLSEPDNDIFLLNNDTIVPPNAIFYLRMGLYSDESVGSTGSVSNNVSNYQEVNEHFDNLADYMQLAKKINVPTLMPWEKKSFLVGFALLIKRVVLDEIGLLDERFTPGNCEDNDIGMHICLAGYKNLLCHNSYIFHYGEASFKKDVKEYYNLLDANAKKLADKYGFNFDYYRCCRNEIIELITEDGDKPIKVLEIGCGLGDTLSRIQYLYPNASVYGIELDSKVVDVSRNVHDIICGDIEEMSVPFEENSFDYIIFGDIIEHLREPWKIVEYMKAYLKTGGCFLCSIKNIMHYSFVTELLKGNFAYKDDGILDRTCLRFFTFNEIMKMFKQDNGMSIEKVNYTLMGDGTDSECYEYLMSMPNIADEIEFLAYQYIVKVKK